MVKVREDMTGWKMWEHGVPDSKLTVIEQADDYVRKNGQHIAQWLCECSCKERKQIIVRSNHLKRGHTKSCGCLQKEITIENNKKLHKTNLYDLNLKDENGLYGVGYCCNTGRKFYFDMDDYDKIKDYCWSESKRQNKNYSSVRAYNKNSKTAIFIHYIIADKYYDHIDRDPFNNRKHNLRKATVSENNRNHNLRTNNKYGVTGIYWSKKRFKWQASICIDTHNKFLGYFTEKEDAIKARLEAEARYFGEFAPQLHLFEQYKINVNKGDLNG